MWMEISVLFAFILASILSIFSKYVDEKNSYRLFKLIPILILIVWLMEHHNPKDTYQNFILIGLCFSILGDFLLLFRTQFKSGLFAFLTGHIWYIVAFCSESWVFPLIPGIILGIICIGMLAFLIPMAGELKIPVFLYICVIALMGLTSIGRHASIQSVQSMFGFVGALFFMVSDSVLGLNKFRKTFQSAEAIILSTYYLGQGMIAYSTF